MASKYELGFAKPPKNSQFKKGQSGNPKGRPKGSVNTMKLIETELDEKIYVKEGNKQITLTKQQAIIKQIINKALKGDTKSSLFMVDVMKELDAYKEEAAAVVNSIKKDDKSILDDYIKSVSKEYDGEIEDV